MFAASTTAVVGAVRSTAVTRLFVRQIATPARSASSTISGPTKHTKFAADKKPIIDWPEVSRDQRVAEKDPSTRLRRPSTQEIYRRSTML